MLRTTVSPTNSPEELKVSTTKPALLSLVIGVNASSITVVLLPLLSVTFFLISFATTLIASPASLYERSLIRPSSDCSMSTAVCLSVVRKLGPSFL